MFFSVWVNMPEPCSEKKTSSGRVRDLSVSAFTLQLAMESSGSSQIKSKKSCQDTE